MNGKNHAIVGAAAGVAVGIASIASGDIQGAVLSIPSALVGAKAPDMDHHNTKQGKAFNAFRAMVPIIAVVFILGYIYCWVYKNVRLNPLIVVIPIAVAYALRDGTWFWGHRHGTHTLVLPIIFIIGYLCLRVAYPVIGSVILSLNAGYLSHLLADICTYDGCPILYPFSKKKVSISSIKSKEEKKCRAVAIVLSVLLIALSIILSF